MESTGVAVTTVFVPPAAARAVKISYISLWPEMEGVAQPNPPRREVKTEDAALSRRLQQQRPLSEAISLRWKAQMPTCASVDRPRRRVEVRSSVGSCLCQVALRKITPRLTI